MSLSPKALALATQLGQLMRAYVPDAEDAHAALELSAAFQAGLKLPQEEHQSVRLTLPMVTGTLDQISSERFTLESPEHLQIDIGPFFLWIEQLPAHFARKKGFLFDEPAACARLQAGTAEQDPPVLVVETFNARGERRSQAAVDDDRSAS